MHHTGGEPKIILENSLLIKKTWMCEMYLDTPILLIEIYLKEVIRDVNKASYVQIIHCTIIVTGKKPHSMLSNLGMLSKCWCGYAMEYYVDVNTCEQTMKPQKSLFMIKGKRSPGKY